MLAEFDGLLKDCIEISEQLTSLDSQVELSWTVEPTGRVGKHEIRPRFLASGAFARCAEEAFARFRYPPFRGPPAEVGYRIDIGS